jgi:DNA-binding IclR family transcriptional regulator
MLVYRDFAVQDESRVYHAGPVLELAAHSPSGASRLRAIALPHLRNVVDIRNESANLIARIGEPAGFIASVECEQSLRVGNREGMVFPAHNITGGLVLLAELSDEQLDALYAERPGERPILNALREDLTHIRRQGFAVNEGRSERGVVAVGCPVRRANGTAAAGMSISMPSVRYDPHRFRSYIATLGLATGVIEVELHKTI